MARTQALLLLLLVVGASAQVVVFTRPDNGGTTATQKANSHIGPVKSCSAVKTKSEKGGWAQGWAQSNAQGIAAAASTCSTSVRNAFADACAGASAVGAITVAAEVCASATAKVYVSTLAKAVTDGNAKACVDTCATAKATAKAVANATGIAITEAISGPGAIINECARAATEVNGTTFASAMTDVTASVLSKACIKSQSKLYTQASAMSSGLASAYAKIFAAALAKACTCGKCTCPKIPSKAQLEDLATSDTYSSIASGRRALTQTVADAAAAFCSGSVTVEAAAKTVIDATVKIYTAALVNSQTVMKIKGDGKGCTNATATLDMASVATAVGNATAAAFAQFVQCGEATAEINNIAFVVDMTKLLYRSTAQSCADKGNVFNNGTSSGSPTNERAAKAITRAFSKIKNTCACKGSCWCSTACDANSYCPSFMITGYGAPMG